MPYQMRDFILENKDTNEVRNWRNIKDKKRKNLMTDEELFEVNNMITYLNHNKGMMQDNYAEWDEIEEYYANNQADKPKSPNSKINVMNASIEGVVSQTVDREIQANVSGVSIEDNSFANIAKNVLNWILRNNNIRLKTANYSRKIEKFGHAWFKVKFDHKYAGGFGLPVFDIVPIDKLFKDTKVTDPLRLCESEYISETINLSKTYARNIYGEYKAGLIDYGYNEFRDNGVFKTDYSVEDEDSAWTLIQWWTQCHGKLRLREFSGCGVLLYDSFKSGKRDVIQDRKISPKSYYKYVQDKYPYFVTTAYQLEGDFYGFGDGKLLLPLQKVINEIYDKIRIQMRPNTAGIDTQSGIDPDALDDNSFAPVPYNGARLQNRPPFYEFRWGTVNAEMFGLLESLHTEAQRVVRFSELMTGLQKQADTATEAAIQQSQGNSKINYDKANIEDTFSNMCKYALGLMMEFSKTGKSLRIENPKGEEKYEWVDARKMAEVPVQMPATKDFQDRYLKKNPNSKPPAYENVTGENGQTLTRDIDLDIYISVGSGLPKNPAFVWSIVEKLSQMQVFDTDEQPPVPKPAINWTELREFMRNTLGIPIKDNEEMKKFVEEYRKRQAMQTKEMVDRTKQAGGMPGAGMQMPGQEGLPPMMEGGPGGNQPEQQPETMGATAGAGSQQEFNNPAGVGGGFRHG